MPEAKTCHEKQDNPIKESRIIQSTKAGNSYKTILHNITNSTDIEQQQPQEAGRSRILEEYTLTRQTIDYDKAVALTREDSKRFQLIGEYLCDSTKMEALSVFRF